MQVCAREEISLTLKIRVAPLIANTPLTTPQVQILKRFAWFTVQMQWSAILSPIEEAKPSQQWVDLSDPNSTGVPPPSGSGPSRIPCPDPGSAGALDGGNCADVHMLSPANPRCHSCANPLIAMQIQCKLWKGRQRSCTSVGAGERGFVFWSEKTVPTTRHAQP